MTDKNINTEREATDKLRSELASVLGKIMGIAAFNSDHLPPALLIGDKLRKIELQITDALSQHREETYAARAAGIKARSGKFRIK